MKPELAYNKKIYDSVHGFIRFNEIEKELIDSLPFQRLHHIHQLGIAFLVYPGATHTRFEHSLGTMELATRIFEHLLTKQMQLDDVDYWKQVVRLSALCHDLGHLPFSHDAESAILGKIGHEEWTVRVIQSQLLKPVWDMLACSFPQRDVLGDIVCLAIGEEKLKEMGYPFMLSSSEKILSQIITADFFGADRIDYLLRDAKCTGVSYGIFDYHQLIEMLCILSSHLGIQGDGVEPCEALLLARHFMHQRVYQYSSVQAYKFHLRRFMKRYYAQEKCLSSLDSYLAVSDNEIFAALRSAANDPHSQGHQDAYAILYKEHRFIPIAIEAHIQEQQLKTLKSILGIPDEGIAWTLSQSLKSTQLNFPVLATSGAVFDASYYSQIRIPNVKKSWLFISREWEKQVRAQLQEM